MNQTLADSLQTALSSLDGVLKPVHEKDSLMHFVSEEEVSYSAYFGFVNFKINADLQLMFIYCLYR